MKTLISSTGGRIVPLTGGLIHYANPERFVDVNEVTVRAAGRPAKVTVEEGLQFDFSQFIKPVKLTGKPGTVYRAK